MRALIFIFSLSDFLVAVSLLHLHHNSASFHFCRVMSSFVVEAGCDDGDGCTLKISEPDPEPGI